MKKLITFYSETHEVLYGLFHVTLKNINKEQKYDLRTKKIDQISPTGEYESPGFDLAMLEKISWIIKNIDVNDPNYLIFSDCDVQFFRDIDEDLGDYDIKFQEDLGSYCAGFFIAKQNNTVLEFFKYVYEALKMNLNGVIHDQTMINYILNNNAFPGIKVGMLPRDKYWTVANINGGKRWEPGDIITEVPTNIVMHHANFTVGISNKINLIAEVRKKYVHSFIN
jgi:hypothetical protein